MEGLQGRLVKTHIASGVLKANPLRDPHVRPLWVYLPPQYDASTRQYPAIYLLHGFAGGVETFAMQTPGTKTVIEVCDDVFGSDVPPAIVVFPDCTTLLGGSQFLDSAAVGLYHTFLCDEVVPHVDRCFRTLPSREHRALAGKSSGGYGAIVTAMLRPDLFSAAATHAGDALFEMCFLPEFGPAARALGREYGGRWMRFLGDYLGREPFSRPSDQYLASVLCMAACYSPTPEGAIEVPFDPHTGELIDAVWAKWLSWDPVRLASKHTDALKSLSGAYIDAGLDDQFFGDLGAQALARALENEGVRAVTLELFEGDHWNIQHRFNNSLRFLVERIAD